jgi:hypothetical protein
MGNAADYARESQWDEFCEDDIFFSFPVIRDPWTLFREGKYLNELRHIKFQLNYNAKNDIWYQDSGSKVKISEMDSGYKNNIVKFLEKKRIKAPKQFLCTNKINVLSEDE